MPLSIKGGLRALPHLAVHIIVSVPAKCNVADRTTASLWLMCLLRITACSPRTALWLRYHLFFLKYICYLKESDKHATIMMSPKGMVEYRAGRQPISYFLFRYQTSFLRKLHILQKLFFNKRTSSVVLLVLSTFYNLIYCF